MLGFLNAVVTNLLNPFLAPAPATGDPFTPVVWAVLAWVRRNVFNEAPTINVAPATTQTGQTVTGVLAADREGDPLTYTVTGATQVGPSTWVTDTGTLTIDQAANTFTYTPNDINYTDEVTHTFNVSATDGKTNLLSLFGVPHSDKDTVGVTVQPPSAVRTIVPLPNGFTDARIPRFAADGTSLLFSATPPGAAAGARQEIYQVDPDGTSLKCLTCGLADPTPPPFGVTGVTTPRGSVQTRPI